MNLRSKKLVVARLLGVGLNRVWFDPLKKSEIKEAITKEDLRKLLSEGVVLVKQKKGISRGRFRKSLLQKRKGRQSGPGSKKGKQTARLGRKESWVNSIRAQRDLFWDLLKKKSISKDVYRNLRRRAKGGFFRSKRHIKLYLTENKMWETKT